MSEYASRVSPICVASTIIRLPADFASLIAVLMRVVVLLPCLESATASSLVVGGCQPKRLSVLE